MAWNQPPMLLRQLHDTFLRFFFSRWGSILSQDSAIIYPKSNGCVVAIGDDSFDGSGTPGITLVHLGRCIPEVYEVRWAVFLLHTSRDCIMPFSLNAATQAELIVLLVAVEERYGAPHHADDTGSDCLLLHSE